MQLYVKITHEGLTYEIGKTEPGATEARTAMIEAFYKDHPEMNNNNSKINLVLMRE